MISNERQYRAASRQRDALAEAMERTANDVGASFFGLEQDHPATDRATFVRQLEWASLAGQIAELDSDIGEYDALRSGKLASTRVTSLADLPDVFVRARIASGLTQRELAQRLGLKEQQVQRYESDRYAGASLERLGQVMAALDVDFDAGVALPAPNALSRLRRRLIEIGFDRRVVDRRLLPDVGKETNDAAALRAAERVARLLAVPVDALLSPDPLPRLATAARFQAPRNASETHLDAYARYAEGVADIVLRATPRLKMERRVGSAREVRDALEIDLARTASAPADSPSRDLLQATLRYCASIGVAVVALRDPGAFHGACFTNGDRAVIVVKHGSDATARWLAVLLHELDHVRDIADSPRRSWIELGDLESWSWDPFEVRANAFAADILFSGRADAVLASALRAAGGSVERLKRAVSDVAESAEVPVDVLAAYLAFRLTERGLNWWPTATGFQHADDAWRLVTDHLLTQLDFAALDDVERRALLDAITP